jgi:hypothetical protein
MAVGVVSADMQTAVLSALLAPDINPTGGLVALDVPHH